MSTRRAVGRALVGGLAVVVTAAVFATAARAALYLRFSTTRLAPGSVVTARTGGEGALARLERGRNALRVFLVRATDVDTIRSPHDARLADVGSLRVDERGNGRLRFVVPDLPRGSYASLTQCAPCAVFSSGRELLPTGPFDEPFLVIDGEGGFSLLVVVLGAAGALLALGAGIWAALRKHARRATPPRAGG